MVTLKVSPQVVIFCPQVATSSPQVAVFSSPDLSSGYSVFVLAAIFEYSATSIIRTPLSTG